jgi:HK97 family phage major capsid protein
MTSKELRLQRKKICNDMNSLLDAWSPENAEKWQRMDKDQKALETQIQAIEGTAVLATELRNFTAPPQRQPGSEFASPPSHRNASSERLLELRSSEDYRQQFDQYLRSGDHGSLLNEVRTYSPMDEGTGTGGQYLIPIGFQKELEVRLKAFGGMRRNCRIINTATGNTLNWPTMDDTANSGNWLSINSAVSQQNPAFGQVAFTANLCSSQQVLIPVQLMQDSAFDVQQFLTDAFGIRIGRTVNNGYTLGNGSGAPNGIVPSVYGYNSGSNIVTARGDTQSGNTEINSVGVNDLANLIAALDPAYRPGAKFMANQATFDFMRRLKDSLGRPLWEASIAQGVPDRIFGYEYDWNQDMAQIGASAYSLLFGQMDKYVIRDVLGFTMVRYNELYMPNHQVGFQAYLRTDGQLIQPAAFRILQHPLS